MEEIITAVVGGAVALVQQLYNDLGHGLGVSVAVTLLSWLTVERLTPSSWAAWKNRSAAAGAGLLMTVLAHLAVPALSYGAGGQGLAAAAFYGILGGGAAWPFHDVIAKRFLPATMLRPNPGAPPDGGGA